MMMFRHTRTLRRLVGSLLVGALLVAGCSDSTDADDASATPPSEIGVSGVRLVTPEDGAAIQSEPPADLVVLDVRTPEEYADGHLDGAITIDFYANDFADQIAELDTDVPYLLYCRSGNRSGETAALMRDLGFTDVAEVDGGILAWAGAGLDIVTD